MSQDEAMMTFIDKVSELMPHLKPYLEALKKEEEALKEAAEMAEATKIADTERQKQEEQRRQIQDALNRQSYNEFRAYAEQQYPNNPDQQGILIRQLQEQHYYQYMQQVYQQQMETQANTLNSPILSSAPTTETLDMSTLNLSDKVDESE